MKNNYLYQKFASNYSQKLLKNKNNNSLFSPLNSNKNQNYQKFS
jgi:hypothetical protein